MADTLGSLCDKLTIVKLKQWHSEDSAKLESLAEQECKLKKEIDEFSSAAICGKIPLNKLTFASNKIYPKEGNPTRDIEGKIGDIFATLATVNCKLWHEQEKIYEFDKVPAEQKDEVIKQLALLNLERNQCIDQIDKRLLAFVKNICGEE